MNIIEEESPSESCDLGPRRPLLQGGCIDVLWKGTTGVNIVLSFLIMWLA